MKSKTENSTEKNLIACFTKIVSPEEISDLANPYGEKGFYSIKWYYGFLAMRPERLGVIWTKSD